VSPMQGIGSRSRMEHCRSCQSRNYQALRLRTHLASDTRSPAECKLWRGFWSSGAATAEFMLPA
jgi:hypothetical protein